MKAQRPRAGIRRAEAVAHNALPDAARGAVFGKLLEEIIVSVEEKRKARSEIVHLHPAAEAMLHILDAVAQGESQLLNGGRAGLADVVAADRDRIELGSVLGAEFDRVGDDAQRRLRRVDVLLL